MANKTPQTPGRSNTHPKPQRDDLAQPGQERERQDDRRTGMDEDDEVE